MSIVKKIKCYTNKINQIKSSSAVDVSINWTGYIMNQIHFLYIMMSPWRAATN